MNTYHIHVYKLEKMAEIDVIAEDETEAMKHGLKRAKEGRLDFKEPDNKFIVLPFEKKE